MSDSMLPLRSWHIAMGLIPGLFLAVGIGLAVAGGSYFWPGIILGYAGIAWLIWDWFFYSKNFALSAKLGGYFGVLVFVLIISWMAFSTAPLKVDAILLESSYFEDTEIAGIKWKDQYYDMRVMMTNGSKEQYTNLEILIRTDLYIANAGFMNNFGQCTAGIESPGRDLAVTIYGLEKKSPVTIPMVPKPGHSFSSIYRIFCDRLLGGDTLEIVTPIVFVPTEGVAARGFLGPRTKPSWITIKANYEGRGHFRDLQFAKCFVGACKNIAMPMKLQQ